MFIMELKLKTIKPMKTILHKYILTEWVNGGFESKCLRYINRETKKSYVSDCNYIFSGRKSNCLNKSVYTIPRKLSKKFFIKEGKIYNRQTYLSNPHGKLEITLIEDIERLVSKYTYAEIFQSDLTKILEEDSYRLIKIEYERKASIKLNFPFIEKMLTYERDIGFFTPREKVVDYLRTLFNREKIYFLHDYESERSNKMSFIQKEMIFMHVNHFAEYKQHLSHKENDNCTIGFWLFKDCLVYVSQSTRDTW